MKKTLSLLLSIMCLISLFSVAVFADGFNLKTTTTETDFGYTCEISEDLAKLGSDITVITTKNITRVENPNGTEIEFKKVDKGVAFEANMAGIYKLYASEIVVTKNDTVINQTPSENSNFDIQNLEVENEDVLIDMLKSYLNGDCDKLLSPTLEEDGEELDYAPFNSAFVNTGKVDAYVEIQVSDVVDSDWGEAEFDLIKENAKAESDIYISAIDVNVRIHAESGGKSVYWKIKELSEPITVTIPVKMDEINKANKTDKEMKLYFLNLHNYPDFIQVPVTKETNSISFKSDKFSMYFLMGNLVEKTKPVTPSYVAPKTGVE